MNNVSEQGAIDDTRKAVVGLSVLMALTSAVLGFVTTGVVAIVWRSITATSLTFYGLAILWLVLGCTVLFATSRTLRRRIGIWAYLLASVFVVLLLVLLALPGYLAILL